MSQSHEHTDRRADTTIPGYIKVFGIVALVLVHIFVVLHIVDPDRYGPRRHSRVGDFGNDKSHKEHGVQQP